METNSCEHRPFPDKRSYELDRLQKEVARLRTMSTTEMCCENLNVKHHVEEWERRCLKAEAENARLAAGLWKLREELANDRTIEAVHTVADLLARSGPALRDLLAPTIERWETLSNSFKTGWAHRCETRHDVILLVENIAKNELARLRGIVEGK